MKEEKLIKANQHIAVVGAGISGILVTNRLLNSIPNCHVTLIDSLPAFGGKSCLIDWDKKEWSPHPALMSQKLFEFAQNAIASSPSEKNDSDVHFEPSGLTLLAQNQKTPLNFLLDEDSNLPKILGGSGAQKAWKDLFNKKIFSQNLDESHSLIKKVSPKTKDYLGSTLKTLSAWNGTTSWQKSSPKAFFERCEYSQSLSYTPDLEKIYQDLLESSKEKNLTFELGKKILSSHFDGQKWQLKTSDKELEVDKLIIAHSPWEALNWVKRENLPKTILKLAFKTKPISLVSLTKKITSGLDTLPRQMIMPAEQATMIVIEDNLYLIHHLDYESSMDAPSVTKALKALKRAAKKMTKYFPELVMEKEHIALHPIAWSQSPFQADFDYIKKLSEYEYFSEHLAFCGEAYGSSYKPDENIIKSVIACVENFAE